MSIDKETIQQVFELEKTAVIPTDLASHISANLHTRPLKLPGDWPSFALTTDIAAAPSTTSHVHTAIADAVKAYDQIWLELAIPASDKSLLARMKRPFHQLALFYVNKLGQKQIVFNDRLLRTIKSLTHLNQEKNSEIQALREQVSQLKQRLEDLEKKQS